MFTLGDFLRAVWHGAINDIKQGFGPEKDPMQKIQKPGIYFGTWGTYQLQVESFMSLDRYWVGTVLREGKPLSVSPSLPDATAAIEHIGTWLEGHGCRALIDGEIRRLSAFLSFATAKS